MKLNIGKKELNIKFGYKPTLKERVISKVVRMGNVQKEDGSTNLEKVEDLLLYLPELLLVGMQVHHEDYRYDYDTKEGKEKQLEKAFALIEEYMDGEDADVMELFNKLNDALTEDSFLASLFRQEQKAEKAENTVQTQEKDEN